MILKHISLYTGPTHCYNLFRASVANNQFVIPKSDANGSFYYLDTNKYNANFTVAVSFGHPSTNKIDNEVGKGYIPFPTKESRYSIMPYLNLKNNIILIHNQTKIPIYGNLIQGSISNTYSIKTRNNDSSCLNFEGNSIALDYCDTSKSSQSFSIKLSGSARNEYILQHNDTQNILSYADGVFTLINQNSVDNTNQLFTMQ